MKAQIITVSPAMATEWLATMKINRHWRQGVSEAYASDMKNKRWIWGQGDPLMFNGDGTLINGQHRLRALLNYGKPGEFLVLRDVPREALHTIDTGRKRTAADQFSIAGKTCAAARTAALALLRGFRISGGKSIHFNLPPGKGMKARGPTVQELFDEEQHWPHLEESLPWAGKASREFRSGAAVFSALHYLLARQDQDAANDFFEKLVDGIGITNKSSAIFALRRDLLRNRQNKTRLTAKALAVKVVKTWNAYRANAPMDKIPTKKTAEGFLGEDIPDIHS